MAERLLTLGWRGGLELLPALLLLRCAVLLVAPGGFSTLLLLRRGGFQLRFCRLATLLLGRRAVVTAVITALGGLLQLRRGRLTLASREALFAARLPAVAVGTLCCSWVIAAWRCASRSTGACWVALSPPETLV